MTLNHESPQAIILMIDDHPANLNIILDYLDDHHFEVITALSGEDGLLRAEVATPDLILLDIMLPNIDGFEVCRRLKRNPATQNIPVLFLSALTDTAQKLKAFQVGAVDFISKPFHQAEVLSRINTHLRLHELNEQLEQRVQSRTADLAQANAKLQENQRRLDNAQRMAKIGDWIWDFKTNTLIWSPEMYRIFGVDPARYTPQIETFITLIHPDDRAMLDLEHFRATIRRKNHTLEYRIIDQSSHKIKHTSLRGEVVFDQTQTPLYFAGTFQDITARKQAEAQIKNHNQLLEQAVHKKQQEMEQLTARMLRQEKLAMVGQISASIAHELRNPLGVIKQSVFYLKRLAQRKKLTADNPKVADHLNLIEDELATTDQVISDLLGSTRVRKPTQEWVNLQALTTHTLKRINLTEQLHLHFYLQPDPFLLAVDRLQFQQVLINLLTNTAQASPKPLEISITAQLSNDGQQCLLKIQDNGPGMAPETVAQVFEPLFTTKATGTGLGLSICKQIIENHGGSMVIHSQLGQGTSVEIVLPAVQEHP